MKAAVVRDDVVLNVIEYDPTSDYDPGEGYAIVSLPEDSMVSKSWRQTSDKTFEPPSLAHENSDAIEDAFRSSVEAATNLQELKAAILGRTGPGAQPRMRSRPQ